MYAIGRTLTPALAARGGYRIRTARRWTTAGGVLLLLVYAMVGWRGHLSWVSVATLVALPAWYATGAWSGTAIEFRARGWIAAGITAMAVLVAGASLVSWIGMNTQGSARAEPVAVYSADRSANDRIGLPAPGGLASATIASGTGTALGDGRTWAWAVFGDAAALRGWRDLRVEAWQGVDGSTAIGAQCVDPGAVAPLAVGAVRVAPAVASAGGSFGYPVPDPATAGVSAWPAGSVAASGAVRLDTIPGLSWACMAVTGMAPGSTRQILEVRSSSR